jgi:hypothetical protein
MINKMQSLTKLIQKALYAMPRTWRMHSKSQGVYKGELQLSMHLSILSYPEQRCDWILAAAPGGEFLLAPAVRDLSGGVSGLRRLGTRRRGQPS